MALLLSLCILLLSALLFYILRSSKRPINYPPGPKWLPWIGNTFHLRKLARKLGGQPHVFDKWAEEYNTPILGLKLNSEYVVVVLSYSLVRAVHTQEEFDGRPDNFFLRLRTMGTRLGITCTDGYLWAEHRSFATRHLRQAGYGRQPMEIQIQNELCELLNIINEKKDSPLWPGSFLPPSVINVIWTLTAGKRIAYNDTGLRRLLDLLHQRSKAFDLSGGILTQMPWLRFFAPEATGYNLISRFNMELHSFFMETIDEHKKLYTDEKSANDLIFAYIKEMKHREGLRDNTFTDSQLTMTILDLFIAGSQTTGNTLDLAIMMTVVRPDLQDKIYAEICKSLKNDIDEGKLPFTEAYLMEVQRFFHITPITGPRRALSETRLGGYTIPKNATILIGLRNVHMDPEHWKDPENFRPERFLNDDQEIITDKYFMPFGQGKRRCLGDSLARTCLFTFFVGILKNFQIQLPDGEEKPSTKLLPGLTLTPKPYKVKFLSR